jgi:ribosome-binding protein aMBF1 (putative translation factor)
MDDFKRLVRNVLQSIEANGWVVSKPDAESIEDVLEILNTEDAEDRSGGGND